MIGNSIGTDVTGTINLGNKLRGIQLNSGASNDSIGGTVPGSGNIIAFNAGPGIRINSAPASTGIAILQNAIYANGTQGIALADDGATPNDPGDADTGPNNFQNFPELGQAMWGGWKERVTYSVASTPGNSIYPLRIEFFTADANGQGQVFLGADTYTAADLAAGGKTFVFIPAVPLQYADKIVATATDSSATGAPANTSEFSTAIVSALDPWHDFDLRFSPLDVNKDGSTAPGDALAIINYLNSVGPGLVLFPSDPLDLPTGLSVGLSRVFIDTDGDTFVAPADALAVINWINAHPFQPAGLDGESSAAIGVVTALADPAWDELSALLAADLATSPKRR